MLHIAPGVLCTGNARDEFFVDGTDGVSTCLIRKWRSYLLRRPGSENIGRFVKHWREESSLGNIHSTARSCRDCMRLLSTHSREYFWCISLSCAIKFNPSLHDDVVLTFGTACVKSFSVTKLTKVVSDWLYFCGLLTRDSFRVTSPWSWWSSCKLDLHRAAIRNTGTSSQAQG